MEIEDCGRAPQEHYTVLGVYLKVTYTIKSPTISK